MLLKVTTEACSLRESPITVPPKRSKFVATQRIEFALDLRIAATVDANLSQYPVVATINAVYASLKMRPFHHKGRGVQSRVREI